MHVALVGYKNEMKPIPRLTWCHVWHVLSISSQTGQTSRLTRWMLEMTREGKSLLWQEKHRTQKELNTSEGKAQSMNESPRCSSFTCTYLILIGITERDQIPGQSKLCHIFCLNAIVALNKSVVRFFFFLCRRKCPIVLSVAFFLLTCYEY